MDIGGTYKITLSIDGGPLGSPSFIITFERNVDVVVFEYFVLNHMTNSNEQIKVGGGGHDIQSAKKIESCLQSLRICPFNVEDDCIDCPSIEFKIEMPQVTIKINWIDECPEGIQSLGLAEELLWNWARPGFKKAGWL